MAVSISAVLPWVLAALLALIHFFGEQLDDSAFAHRDEILSFTAGVTVTYVFLQLLPEHHTGVTLLGEHMLFSILFGFSIIHVAEKWVYQHHKSRDEIRHEYKEIHSAFLIAYYFAIGLLIHEMVGISAATGVTFFIPIMFHTAISSFSLMELHEELLDNTLVRILITVAVFPGVAASAVLGPSPQIFYTVLGFVTGMFLYVAVRDAIPTKRSGAPLYYLLGVITYSAVMAYIWLIG